MEQTLQVILQNLATNLPPVEMMVQDMAFIAGLLFFVRGIYQFKQYGELRTSMAVQTDIKGPLLSLLVGSSLMFWPTLLSISMTSVFNTTSLLSYQPSSATTNYSSLLQAGGEVLRFVGYIAFFRGWILLTRLGSQGQPGTLGKALSHIIGGICAINVFGTWQIISNTLFSGSP